MAGFSTDNGSVCFVPYIGENAGISKPIEDSADEYGQIIALVMQLEPICALWPKCSKVRDRIGLYVDDTMYAAISFSDSVTYSMLQDQDAMKYSTTDDIAVFRRFSEYIHSKLDDIKAKEDAKFIKDLRNLKPNHLTKSKK